MGLGTAVGTFAILVTAFVVANPVDAINKQMFPSRWPTVYDVYEKEGDIRKATESSFTVEAREAYLEWGATHDFWYLVYCKDNDKDSDEFLPTWRRLHAESDSNTTKFIMLDGFLHRSIGWTNQFKHKAYTALPHLYYIRQGKWYASKTLVGNKLLKMTAGNNIEPLQFFAEKGWEMAQSGDLPPPATKEMVRRAQVLKAVVKVHSVLRKQGSDEQWMMGCAVLVALIFVFGSASKPSDDKTAKQAEKKTQ